MLAVALTLELTLEEPLKLPQVEALNVELLLGDALGCALGVPLPLEHAHEVVVALGDDDGDGLAGLDSRPLALLEEVSLEATLLEAEMYALVDALVAPVDVAHAESCAVELVVPDRAADSDI